LPFAPYTLVTFSENRELNNTPALAVVVGGFTEPGASDVVALGAGRRPGDSYTLWLVQDITGGTHPPRLIEFDALEGAEPTYAAAGPEGSRLSVAALATDLDGDGFDELVGMMPFGADDCVLLSYDVDAVKARANLKGQLRLGERCTNPELGVWHGDNSGPALLLLTGDAQVGSRHLSMIWDVADGFHAESRTFIDTPGEDVRGFASFSPARLAVVTDWGLSIFRSGKDFEYLTTRQRLQPFTDARAVTSIDANLDGLADLAVADGEGLWLVSPELR
jgi:hypothetical protein